MMKDEDRLGGYVDVEVIRDGKNGPEVIAHARAHNLIVNVGKKWMWKITINTNTKQ